MGVWSQELVEVWCVWGSGGRGGMCGCGGAGVVACRCGGVVGHARCDDRVELAYHDLDVWVRNYRVHGWCVCVYLCGRITVWEGRV